MARVELPLHAGVSGPHAGRTVRLADRPGKVRGSVPLRSGSQPFASICGRVCGHPCEPACRRGQLDMPISIRALKRFVTERHGPESRNPIDVFAGDASFRPAGKNCHYRFRSGRDVGGARFGVARLSRDNFRSRSVPGGMMHLGIPEYRLPRDVLQAQIREILDLGPELRLNARLGKDFSLEDLRRQGYKAVLLAFGLHRSRDLNLPGHELDGVVKGIDFLLNVNLGYRFSIGKQVVVIGGGNVAIDVARSAMREQQKLAPWRGRRWRYFPMN